MAKMQTELNGVYAALETKKKELAETMKKEKKLKRVAALVESGVASEVVNNLIDTLESVDDASFDAITSLVAAVNPVKVAEIKTNHNLVTEDSQHPLATISDALETAEVENDIDLSVGSESEPETHNTRAALIDFVYSRLGKKLNKGE
jgi:histidyl-tRNA synthetase